MELFDLKQYKVTYEFSHVGNGVTQAIVSFVKNIVKNALFRYANSRITQDQPCAVRLI